MEEECSVTTDVTQCNVTTYVTECTITTYVTECNVTTNVTEFNVTTNVTACKVTTNVTECNVTTNVAKHNLCYSTKVKLMYIMEQCYNNIQTAMLQLKTERMLHTAVGYNRCSRSQTIETDDKQPV